MSNPATWVNGVKTLVGTWSYYWPADRFTIVLFRKDRPSVAYRRFTVYGETPEWGKWKLRKP